jgi:hypothetical protein
MIHVDIVDDGYDDVRQHNMESVAALYCKKLQRIILMYGTLTWPSPANWVHASAACSNVGLSNCRCSML